VPEQLLRGADVGAGLQKMRRERMAQGVAACPLGDAGVRYGSLHRALEDALVDVVPPVLAR